MKCIVRGGFVRGGLGIRDISKGWGSIGNRNRRAAGIVFALTRHMPRNSLDPFRRNARSWGGDLTGRMTERCSPLSCGQDCRGLSLCPPDRLSFHFPPQPQSSPLQSWIHIKIRYFTTHHVWPLLAQRASLSSWGLPATWSPTSVSLPA